MAHIDLLLKKGAGVMALGSLLDGNGSNWGLNS